MAILSLAFSFIALLSIVWMGLMVFIIGVMDQKIKQ